MTQALVLVILVFVLIPAFWAVSTSNRFTRLEKLVEESWANVDVALKRRHDLIPNLVETVKAYAAHEREMIEKLVHAREKAVTGRAQEESDLARMVSAVIAWAEDYPELKSSENFIELQYELSNSEDRVAAARRFYNANVRDFNILIATFPSRLIAGGRTPKEFFEVESIEVRTRTRVKT